jgi:elongator complex protein 3
MGGTFSSLPKKYQVNFIKRCFDAANQKDSKSLEDAQKLNEQASDRIIGITLETRPDQITKEEIKTMLSLGGTRCEIGVQTIYDDVLKKVKRGHGVKDTVKATKLLKDAGFKICYHMMPNLPGSDLEKDLKMFKTIFTDPRFMPDMIKIYPCIVVYQAELYNWFNKGKFEPYKDNDLIDLLIKIKKIVPQWIRINRLGRDIPVPNIAAGNKISNIRQVLQRKMKSIKAKCNCIRCREIRSKITSINQTLRFNQLKYDSSGGVEYFLQYVDKNIRLYALLRLRIFNNSAIVRELHTYGLAIPLNKEDAKAAQHRGLGKKLLKKAENITKKHGIKKLTVISGIGAREYYIKLGYRLQGNYMVKIL